MDVQNEQSCSRCTTSLHSCWCTERADLQSMHNFAAKRLAVMLIYRASRAVVDAQLQCKASSPHVGVRSAQSCSRCTTLLRSVLPWCWCTQRAELQSMHNFTANRLPLMLIYRPSRAVDGAQLRYKVYWCTERAELQSMHNFTAKRLPLMLMYRAGRAAVDAQRHYKACFVDVDVQSE